MLWTKSSKAALDSAFLSGAGETLSAATAGGKTGAGDVSGVASDTDATSGDGGARLSGVVDTVGA